MTNRKSGKPIGTSRGVILDDDEIQRLADEAEAGYEPEQLRSRGGRPLMGSSPAAVVPVRLDPELKAAVDARAAVDGVTASEIIRAALRQFLSAA